jgi:hypothetical protein
VPEGTLLTAYENPTESPNHEPIVGQPYRVNAAPATARPRQPVFLVRTWDAAAKPARLRVYMTFATTSPAWTDGLPALQRLKDELGAEGVDLVAVPVDAADDNSKLGDYAKKWRPPARLVNLVPARRPEALAAFAKALGQDASLPSTVATDEAGRVLLAQPGIPTISAIRRALPDLP